MSLINCPECEKEVSSQAVSCPHCGFPLQSDDSDYLACPKCLSKRLHIEKAGFSGKKAFAGALLTGGIGILAGTIGSKNLYITCLSCSNRFKAKDAYLLKVGKSAEALDKKIISEYEKHKSLMGAVKLYHDETKIPLVKSKEYVTNLLKRNNIEVVNSQLNSVVFIIVVIFVLFITIIFLVNDFSCKNNRSSIENSIYQENKSYSNNKDSFQISQNLVVGEIYKIEGTQIALRTGPGDNFDKLINEKFSNLINEIHYANVDGSTKIKLLNLKIGWAKVQVVEPEWLKETHIGWIPIKHVVEKQLNEILFEEINKDFLIFLLESIKNKELIEKELNKLYFFEDANGIYKFQEKIRNKGIHVIDIVEFSDLVIFHTVNKDLFIQISGQLNEIKNQQEFIEASDIGKRFQEEKYIFETLEPKSGIDPQQNIYYDIYVYRNKSVNLN
ncbi:MAG: zinc ribbon domain-containing protein [Mariniphaga sp.]|nr:zinc ribbon domain-containing protein [Mariniphaga sp.]